MPPLGLVKAASALPPGTVDGMHEDYNYEAAAPKLRKLEDHAKMTQQKIPLLLNAGQPTRTQIKRYIVTYYEPVLSEFEIQSINSSINDDKNLEKIAKSYKII